MAQLLLNGLVFGAIYALAALGFVLIHNASGAVNFGHGDLVVFGGYLGAAFAVGAMGVSPWVALLIVPALMAVLGVLLQRVAYNPLRDKPFVTVFIATLAVGLILSNLALIIWGPDPIGMRPFSEARIEFLGMDLSGQAALILGAAAVLVAFQGWLFTRTTLGWQLRATAEDQEAARLIGIPVDRMTLVTFVLAAVYAGVAGVLLAPNLLLDYRFGPALILRIYVAAIIGGFGSLRGAVLGGLLLGTLEVLVAGYISSSYRDAIIFGLLIVVLFFRPQGIMGEPISDKA